MARFCEQCGEPLQPNENFCSSCGAKVLRDEPQPYTPPPQSTHVESTSAPVESKSAHAESKSTPAESQSTPAENHMGKFLALVGILVILGAVAYKFSTPYNPVKEYNTSWTVDGYPTKYLGVIENGFGCAIYSISYADYISSDYGSYHRASGQYYIVTVIIENQTSDSTENFEILLLDEKYREYSDDIDASATYEVMNNIPYLKSLESHRAYLYSRVFDIPYGTTITNLRFKYRGNNFAIPFRVATE